MSQYDSDIKHSSIILEYEGTPGNMTTAGPVLTHLDQVSHHCEDILKSLTGDMEMSSLAYAGRKAIHRALQSQTELSYLNNLVQTIVGFMTSTTVVGYLDGIENNRLEKACDLVCPHFHLI
jgi:hypothetical protein